MVSFFDRLDSFAGIENGSGTAKTIDRLSFVFLILTAVSAPHSIAATQVAWACGLLCVWLRRLWTPRSAFRIHALEMALWAFFGWSVISAVFSYEPAVSLDRLRGVSAFLLFIFAVSCIRNRRTAYLAAFALIVSCMVNVLMVPIQRIVGRGIEVHGLAVEGPLAKAGLVEGDAILKLDGRRVSDPAEIVKALETRDSVKLWFNRPDVYLDAVVRRSDLLSGTTPQAALGFATSGPSHYWRVAGFFNHYTTYAEVLQLVLSLIFGLLFVSFRRRDPATMSADAGILSKAAAVFTSRYFLLFAFLATSLALLLTATRASQLSFLISAFVIVAVTASRKFILTAVIVALPVALVGLFLLQQSRQIGFFDSKDPSTLYRLTMWRDGVRLTFDSPRNAVFGVGMDSVQKRWQQWGMYDNGWLPMGHFHSTPVQIMTERGLPALAIWLLVLAIYARTLWRGIKLKRPLGRLSLGILTGCLGGLVGFISSGFVHWNLGDAEVAMVFFLLMGVGVSLAEAERGDAAPAGT